MRVCTLARAVKIHGTRYGAGAVIEVTPEEYEYLLGRGLLTPMAPTAQPKVKVPRSREDKQTALAEAVTRVTKVAGVRTDSETTH